MKGLYNLLQTLGLAVSPKLVMEYQKSSLPVIIGKDRLWSDVKPLIDRLDDDSVIEVVFKN